MTSSSPGGVRHGGHQFSGFHGGHLGGGRRDPGRREENHFQVVGSGFRCGLGRVQGIGGEGWTSYSSRWHHSNLYPATMDWNSAFNGKCFKASEWVCVKIMWSTSFQGLRWGNGFLWLQSIGCCPCINRWKGCKKLKDVDKVWRQSSMRSSSSWMMLCSSAGDVCSAPSAASNRAAYLQCDFGRTHCSARICNGHPEKVQLKHFGHPPSHLPHSNFGFWALFATSASQVLRRGGHHFGCERPHQPIAAYGPAARIQLLRSHAGGAAGDIYLWLQAPWRKVFSMGRIAFSPCNRCEET